MSIIETKKKQQNILSLLWCFGCCHGDAPYRSHDWSIVADTPPRCDLMSSAFGESFSPPLAESGACNLFFGLVFFVGGWAGQTLKRKEKEYEHEMERLAREKIATQQRLAELKKELSQRMDALEIERLIRQSVQPEDDQASTSTASGRWRRCSPAGRFLS